MKNLLFVFGFLLLFGADLSAQTFQIKPGGTVTICDQDSVKLQATTGFAKYLWNTGASSSSIVVKKAGTYYCGAADSRGNTYYDSVVVKVVFSIAPKITTNPVNQTICKGDSFGIDINNPKAFSSIQWPNGKSSNSYVFYPTSSGSTWVITVDTNGCTKKTYIQYTVKSCSSGNGCDIIHAWPDAVLCGDKDSVLVEAKSGYKSYEWLDGVSGRIRTIKAKGVYVLKAKDSAGNYCYDTLEVSKGTSTLTINSIPNPPKICPGDSIKLYVYGTFKSVKWSTNETSNHIYVKPTRTTGYTVTVETKDGCTITEDIKVEMNSTCDSCSGLIYDGKRTLCGLGDSLSIEAKRGFHSYKWSTGATSSHIKVKNAGWYILEATTSGGKKCIDSVYIGTTKSNLTIATLPSHPVVCKNDVVKLKATKGFKSYVWNTGQKYSDIEHKAVETKTLIVYATDSAGCIFRAEVKVIVKDTCGGCNDILSLGKKTNICGPHDSIILEAKSGFKTYVWSTGHTDRIYVAKKAGCYIVVAVDNAGNVCTDSVCITKGSNQMLAIDLYPGGRYCVGDTIFAKATTGFKSYAWNTGSKDRIVEFVAAKRKVLVVEATDSFGCDARKEIVIEADSCKVGIQDILERSVSVHPIPSTGMVYVKAEMPINQIHLFDMTGRIVYSKNTNESSLELTFKELVKGQYILQIELENKLVYKRIVLE